MKRTNWILVTGLLAIIVFKCIPASAENCELFVFIYFFILQNRVKKQILRVYDCWGDNQNGWYIFCCGGRTA